jgi:hypothetical protein
MFTRWHWWGGIETFSSYSDQSGSTFFTHGPTISNFKAMIKYILLRVNSITGVQYRNDPSILAWETGNELCNLDFSIVPGSWTTDIAKFIKSIDTNHLVMDGSYMYWGIAMESLTNPDIDIISNHYYNMDVPPACRGQGCIQSKPSTWYSYAARIAADAALAESYGKPFVAGEIGLAKFGDMNSILSGVGSLSAVAGALVWSLRSHSRDGGFYWHSESQPYAAYHLPGFPEAASGAFPPDEMSMGKLVKSLASRHMNPLGNPFYNSPPSPAPTLILNQDGGLTWSGSAGASWYRLEYSTDSNGPFSVLSDGLMDNVVTGGTIFRGPLQNGYYRVLAKNEFGNSPYSGIFKV